MLNYIWSFMIIISIITAAFTGKLDTLATNTLNAAGDAITMVLSLTGAMCFWSGLLEIAREGGIMRALTRILHPITRLLFPSLDPKSDAAGAIASNMSANMLGMGNAATPLGIKAMNELDKLNGGGMYVSNAMCMFAVINTASIQLIPTTMLSVLSGAGASNPFDIILPTLLSSILSFTFAAFMCALLSKKDALRLHKKL